MIAKKLIPTLLAIGLAAMSLSAEARGHGGHGRSYGHSSAHASSHVAKPARKKYRKTRKVRVAAALPTRHVPAAKAAHASHKGMGHYGEPGYVSDATGEECHCNDAQTCQAEQASRACIVLDGKGRAQFTP